MTLSNTCVFCSTCLMMIIKLEQTFKRRKIIYSRINTRENYYEQRITCLFAANILQWKKRFVNFEFKCFFYPLGIVSTGFYLLVTLGKPYWSMQIEFAFCMNKISRLQKWRTNNVPFMKSFNSSSFSWKMGAASNVHRQINWFVRNCESSVQEMCGQH